jgi:hypothetical protein
MRPVVRSSCVSCEMYVTSVFERRSRRASRWAVEAPSQRVCWARGERGCSSALSRRSVVADRRGFGSAGRPGRRPFAAASSSPRPLGGVGCATGRRTPTSLRAVSRHTRGQRLTIVLPEDIIADPWPVRPSRSDRGIIMAQLATATSQPV